MRVLIYWILAILMFFLLLPVLLYKGIKKPSTAVWASKLFNKWYGGLFNFMFKPEIGRFGLDQQASIVIARNMFGGSDKNRKLFKALAKPLELFDKDHFTNL